MQYKIQYILARNKTIYVFDTEILILHSHLETTIRYIVTYSKIK